MGTFIRVNWMIYENIVTPVQPILIISMVNTYRPVHTLPVAEHTSILVFYAM